MRSWVRRALAALSVAGLAAAGYATWQYGHPAMPTGAVTLPTSQAPQGALTASFFGTTTLAFSDGDNAVMVDAFLSRPGIGDVLFGTLSSDKATIDRNLTRAGVGKVDLLVVTHSHYDHALDAAAITGRTGATIVGSPSTAQIARGSAIPERFIATVQGGERFTAGDFRVTLFRSLHSRGDRIPGRIDAPIHQPAKAEAYREGGTYAALIEHRGQHILVHASANMVPGMYRGVRADIVFLAIGGLSSQPAAFTDAYWREVVEATGAKLVVPIHWDDFLEPLDRPLHPLRRFMDDIPLTMERIAPLAARDGVEIRFMPPLVPVDLESPVRARGGRIGTAPGQ